MSTRLRVWIFGACALAFAQTMASLCLHQNFTLTAVSDIVQTLLLLSGTLALLPNDLTRDRAPATRVRVPLKIVATTGTRH